jgi:hypothetical protein
VPFKIVRGVSATTRAGGAGHDTAAIGVPVGGLSDGGFGGGGGGALGGGYSGGGVAFSGTL